MEYNKSEKIGEAMKDLECGYYDINSSNSLYLYLEARDKIIGKLDIIKHLKKKDPNWKPDNDILKNILNDDIIDKKIIIEMKNLAKERHIPIERD